LALFAANDFVDVMRRSDQSSSLEGCCGQHTATFFKETQRLKKGGYVSVFEFATLRHNNGNWRLDKTGRLQKPLAKAALS
jgi:hypothetical protein